MEKELGVSEAREKFSDLVESVQYQGKSFIINRHGKPAAAVVPIEVYNSWKGQRSEFFERLRQIQHRADLDPEEAVRLAQEAIDFARQRS